MPLVSRSRAVSIAFGTVSFFMADDDKTVRVDISQDLLARFEAPPPVSRHGYVEFAQIAEAKYDEGQYDREVRVFVVRITNADLIE